MHAQLSSRVVCRRLDWDLSAAEMLRADPQPAALLGAWAGGSDIVAACPVRTGEELDATDAGDMPERAGRACFGGGWIGYLGFGAAGGMLPVPPAPGEPRRLPACWFGYYDHVLRRDRATGRWTFEALVTPGREDALESDPAAARIAWSASEWRLPHMGHGAGGGRCLTLSRLSG